MSDTNTSSSTNMCQICNAGQAKYTCPRCSLPYCSIDCYKSTSHLDCSEEFYKECVELEMKNANNPEDKNKMMEILKRVHEQDMNSDPLDDNIDDDDNFVDSDDDDEMPDLAERIKNVNLNNADELWAVLTDSERQEFEAILKNGEENKILPLWEPWWSKIEPTKLVEVIDESKESEKSSNNNLPTIMNIPVIESLEKASPLIAFNLLNVLSSYVCTVLHYNGEHKSSARNTVIMLLELSDNMKKNKIFEKFDLAIESVVEKALELELFFEDEGKEAITTSVKQIVNGPNEKIKNFYILTALSDLHETFIKAKHESSKDKSESSISSLPKKMQTKLDDKCVDFLGKKYQLFLKKLEYYLAWANKFPDQLSEIMI